MRSLCAIIHIMRDPDGRANVHGQPGNGPEPVQVRTPGQIRLSSREDDDTGQEIRCRAASPMRNTSNTSFSQTI